MSPDISFTHSNPSPPQTAWTIQAGQGRGCSWVKKDSQANTCHGHRTCRTVVLDCLHRYTDGYPALVNSMFTLFMISSGSGGAGKDGLYPLVVIVSAGLGLLGAAGRF